MGHEGLLVVKRLLDISTSQPEAFTCQPDSPPQGGTTSLDITASPLVVATFWAAALGSTVDEDSTEDRAWVEPAGWGGPSMWFQRVSEQKTAKNRQHFDLRACGDLRVEVDRLRSLGAVTVREGEDIVVMQDPEGNEFCVEV